MYNDPNQPPYGQPPQGPNEMPPTQYAPQQPPYGQPPMQPPYPGQPPAYGQPPMQQPPPYGQQQYGVPPIPAGYAAPPPQKKSLKWLWITLGVVGAIFVLSCAACGSWFLFSGLSNNPNSTVDSYYKAVESQDYATAYTYLAPGATFTNPQNGQTIPIPTETVYAAAAQGLDKDLGTLTDYQTSSGSDTNHVVVTVTRGGKQYVIHLTMVKINNDWKITNADGI
jgi:hypothetical protein